MYSCFDIEWWDSVFFPWLTAGGVAVFIFLAVTVTVCLMVTVTVCLMVAVTVCLTVHSLECLWAME